MKIEWEREFGSVGNWRVEKLGKADGARLGYLLSDTHKTYIAVNPGPFASPEERDENIIADITRREKAR